MFRALRVGIAVLASMFASQSFGQNTYDAAQGWSKADMKIWYEASQGSRLIRRDWFEALKDEEGKPIASREVLEGLGYLYLSNDPASLPAGWVYDKGEDGEAIGLNCSACHTAKLKHKDHEVLIHGAQIMADFQGFMNLLVASVDRTLNDPSKFDAFSKAVLGASPVTSAKLRLKSDLAQWQEKRGPIHATTETSVWGRGRADAVGIILSTTASVVARPPRSVEEAPTYPESNAPVSYPFAWNANQQGVLQHNGVVDNGANLGLVEDAKIGALIRNWTEALGVFAEVSLSDDGKTVKSSINFRNLLLLEQALAKLQSPQWPKEFGPIDNVRRAKGEQIFLQRCASCHGQLAHDDLETNLPLVDEPVDVKSQGHRPMVYLQRLFDARTEANTFLKTLNADPAKFIGTDPAMACNALMHTSFSGKMEGLANVEGFLPTPGEKNFAERAVTTDLLRALIQRDVLSNKSRGILTFAENQSLAVLKMFQQYAFADYEDDPIGQNAPDDPLQNLRGYLMRCANHLAFARVYRSDVPLPAYKARPLNGIWATAPYLHNGSVPTLYDLLLPPEQRPATHSYYDGEMDVEKVGLKNAADNPKAFQFKVRDDDGYVIVGNWNGGHEYGNDLDEEERRDLVEYLKGL